MVAEYWLHSNDPAVIAVVDIVTLNIGDMLVTHRVVEILYKEGDPKPWLRTKGDANEEPDANLLSPKGHRAPRVVLYIPEMTLTGTSFLVSSLISITSSGLTD